MRFASVQELWRTNFSSKKKWQYVTVCHCLPSMCNSTLLATVIDNTKEVGGEGGGGMEEWKKKCMSMPAGVCIAVCISKQSKCQSLKKKTIQLQSKGQSFKKSNIRIKTFISFLNRKKSVSDGKLHLYLTANLIALFQVLGLENMVESAVHSGFLSSLSPLGLSSIDLSCLLWCPSVCRHAFFLTW